MYNEIWNSLKVNVRMYAVAVNVYGFDALRLYCVLVIYVNE